MNQILLGALAGLVATVPMTAAMEAMHRFLPEEERYPLPPRQVAMGIAEEAGIKGRLNEPERTGFTLASHFGFGAVTGALCAPLAQQIPLPPAVGGACLGLAVWAGSYLGMLPAIGLLRPATEHPSRRNALMITAHLVWGATLGLLVERAGKDVG